MQNVGSGTEDTQAWTSNVRSSRTQKRHCKAFGSSFAVKLHRKASFGRLVVQVQSSLARISDLLLPIGQSAWFSWSNLAAPKRSHGARPDVNSYQTLRMLAGQTYSDGRRRLAPAMPRNRQGKLGPPLPAPCRGSDPRPQRATWMRFGTLRRSARRRIAERCTLVCQICAVK